MKSIKRILSLALIVCALVSALVLPASAADNGFGILSSSKYAKVYTISTSGTTIPYTTSSLKTRGTVTYGASSSSYIDNASDEIYLLKVGSDWAYVSYPTASGRVKAYIKLSAITSATPSTSMAKTVATAKFSCAPRYGKSVSSSYYVDEGDTVYKLGTKGSYTQILYPSGSVYRIAWCKTSDYTKYCSTSAKTTTSSSSNSTGSSSTTVSGWNAKLGTTVASIRSGGAYTKYYGSGNLSYNGGFTGQCTWYAYGRFYEVCGIRLDSAYDAKQWLSANATDTRVKVVYGASKIRSQSIAVRTTGTWGHVMFIEYVSYDSNGNPQYVYFTECNNDGNGTYDAGTDCILKRLTYKEFVAQKNPAGYIYKA